MIEISWGAYFLSLLMLSQLYHPLQLCLLLVASSFMVGLVLSSVFTKWMMYALIMVFLGGMMVVFLYVTTLSNNEKYLSPKPNMYKLMAAAFLLSMVTALTPLELGANGHLLSLIYHFPNTSILWAGVAYLLAVLLISVKMAESHKGTLVKLY